MTGRRVPWQRGRRARWTRRLSLSKAYDRKDSRERRGSIQRGGCAPSLVVGRGGSKEGAPIERCPPPLRAFACFSRGGKADSRREKSKKRTFFSKKKREKNYFNSSSSSSISSPNSSSASLTGWGVDISTPAIFSRETGSVEQPPERNFK